MNLAPKGTPTVTAAAGTEPGIRDALPPFLAASVVYVVILAVGANLLNDADTYWHLAAGDWILANGFPRTDPFSFTFAGKPWIAKEWLSQIVYAFAFRAGGWSAVAALAAAAFAAAFALLARALQARLATIPVLVCLAAAFVLAAPHAVARPHLLALPVMVAWAAGLVGALDRRRPPPYALLPLMILWANLHGSFLLGILLAGAAALEAIIAADRSQRWRALGQWTLFIVAVVVAACATPYGPGTALAALDVLRLGPVLPLISEFRAADFSHLDAFEVVLLGAAGLAVYRGVKLPAVRILVLLGLVHLALSGARYAETLGLLAPLFLAAPLARQFPALRPAAPAGMPGRSAVLGVGGTAALMLVAATVAFTVYLRPEPAAKNTPAAAVAALRGADAGPLLNDYQFGGYLIFSGIPTFIDGRAELYGPPFFMGYHRSMTLTDLPGLMTMLDERGIGATLLAPQTPAVAFLDTLSGWRRFYADDVAVVHVRVPP